jgi:hypothetical protein
VIARSIVGHGIEPRRAEIVFFDGGGGHRSAAVALKEVLETERRWDGLLNLVGLLDSVDLIRRVFGVRMQDVYLRAAEAWVDARRLTPHPGGAVHHPPRHPASLAGRD